jgi:hypothetical protein
MASSHEMSLVEYMIRSCIEPTSERTASDKKDGRPSIHPSFTLTFLLGTVNPAHPKTKAGHLVYSDLRDCESLCALAIRAAEAMEADLWSYRTAKAVEEDLEKEEAEAAGHDDEAAAAEEAARRPMKTKKKTKRRRWQEAPKPRRSRLWKKRRNNRLVVIPPAEGYLRVSQEGGEESHGSIPVQAFQDKVGSSLRVLLGLLDSILKWMDWALDSALGGCCFPPAEEPRSRLEALRHRLEEAKHKLSNACAGLLDDGLWKKGASSSSSFSSSSRSLLLEEEKDKGRYGHVRALCETSHGALHAILAVARELETTVQVVLSTLTDLEEKEAWKSAFAELEGRRVEGGEGEGKGECLLSQCAAGFVERVNSVLSIGENQLPGWAKTVVNWAHLCEFHEDMVPADLGDIVGEVWAPAKTLLWDTAKDIASDMLQSKANEGLVAEASLSVLLSIAWDIDEGMSVAATIEKAIAWVNIHGNERLAQVLAQYQSTVEICTIMHQHELELPKEIAVKTEVERQTMKHLLATFQASADDEINRAKREVLRTFLATKVVTTIDRNLRRIVEVRDAVLDCSQSPRSIFFPEAMERTLKRCQTRAQEDLRNASDTLLKSFPTSTEQLKHLRCKELLASHQTQTVETIVASTKQDKRRPDIPGSSLPRDEKGVDMSQNRGESWPEGGVEGNDTEEMTLLKQRLKDKDLELERLHRELEHARLHKPMLLTPIVNTDDDMSFLGGDPSLTTNVYVKLDQLKKYQAETLYAFSHGVHEKLDQWKLEQVEALNEKLDQWKLEQVEALKAMKQEPLDRVDNARLTQDKAPAPTKPEGVSHEHEKQILENEKQILENEKQILEGLANIQSKLLQDSEKKSEEIQKLDQWKLEQVEALKAMKQELLDRIDDARLTQDKAPAPTKPEGVSHEHEKQILENEKQILENEKQILEGLANIQKKMQYIGERTEMTENHMKLIEDQIKLMILIGSENAKGNRSNKEAEGVSHENEKQILEGLEKIQRKLQDFQQRMSNTNPNTQNSEEMMTKMQEIGARTKNTEEHMKLTEEQAKLILHALAGIQERIPQCPHNAEEIQTKMEDIGERTKRMEEHMKLVVLEGFAGIQERLPHKSEERLPHKSEGAKGRASTKTIDAHGGSSYGGGSSHVMGGSIGMARRFSLGTGWKSKYARTKITEGSSHGGGSSHIMGGRFAMARRFSQGTGWLSKYAKTENTEGSSYGGGSSHITGGRFAMARRFSQGTGWKSKKRTKSTEEHMKLTEEQVKLILHALAGIQERIPQCPHNAEEIQTKMEDIGERTKRMEEHTKLTEEQAKLILHALASIQEGFAGIQERLSHKSEKRLPHKSEDAKESPATKTIVAHSSGEKKPRSTSFDSFSDGGSSYGGSPPPHIMGGSFAMARRFF